MTLASEAFQISKILSSSKFADLSVNLCDGIQRFLGAEFKVAPGQIGDSEHRSATFGAVVQTAAAGEPSTPSTPVPPDSAAAVIDVRDTIDVDSLRAACDRIAEAKALRKTPIPAAETLPRTNNTFGIVFARSATTSVDRLSDELERWRESRPSVVWPDLVVILNTAVIGLGVQFPTEDVSGDFMMPVADSMPSLPPPIYVLGVIRPITEFAFNKMASLLVIHAKLFRPAATLPNFADIIEGMPNTGFTRGGYQFNLAGDLVPVPRDRYNDRYLPPMPLRIEDAGKKLLGTVQLLPWQDGHVIALRGKLPLEGFLLFGPPKVAGSKIVRTPNEVQLSYVLPISVVEFNGMLRNFEQRSNMKIRKGQTQWIVQKIGDEGTSSPFVARLMLGVYRTRDSVYPKQADRDKFDSLYELTLSAMNSTREAAKEIVSLWDSHKSKIGSGQGVRRGDRTLHIDEHVDKDLRKLTETLLNSSVRGLKHGLQQLALELKHNLGFWFEKQSRFERGVSELRITDSDLANYMERCRAEWLQTLVMRRNAVEHEGWSLPRVLYRDTGSTVEVEAPLIDGQAVDQYVTLMTDRMCCAIEDVLMHLLNKQLPGLMCLSETPLQQRDPQNPTRFFLTLRTGGALPWRIQYSTSKFEDV
jgi:hypothetical protein